MLVSGISNLKTSNVSSIDNLSFKGNPINSLSRKVIKNAINSNIADEVVISIAKKASSIVNEKELPATKNPVVAAMEESTKQLINKGATIVEDLLDKVEPADPTGISFLLKLGMQVVKVLTD